LWKCYFTSVPIAHDKSNSKNNQRATMPGRQLLLVGAVSTGCSKHLGVEGNQSWLLIFKTTVLGGRWGPAMEIGARRGLWFGVGRKN